MHVALLGGSFDPPHRGHVEVLRFLLNSKKYDEVWVVPSRQNPLKTISSSFDDRLKMCHLAFDSLGEKIRILDIEKNLSGYTRDLVEHLQKKFPAARITFVGGTDLKKQLDRWKDSRQLQAMIDFDFFPRGPEENSPFPQISSTDLRKIIGKGRSTGDFLPEAVKAYIQKHHLYREAVP